MMFSGDTVELGDASEGPGKSFLFFLTNRARVEWDYPEMLSHAWQSRRPFRLSWCALDGP